MLRTLINLTLSVAIIITPQHTFAAGAPPEVVSPVPSLGAHTAICAPQNATRKNCTATVAAVTGETIVYPVPQWQEISSRPLSADEFRALHCKIWDSGQQRCLEGARRAGAVGALAERGEIDGYSGVNALTNSRRVSHGRTVSRVRSTDAPHHSVIGLYDRTNRVLRIVATRINRGVQQVRDGDGNLLLDANGNPQLNDYAIRLYQTVIGPQHFDYMKASRSLLPMEQRGDAGVAGINPFERFDIGDADQLFHNIDFSAALTAVSMAQRLVNAPVGWMASSTPRIGTREEVKSGVLKKTIKIYLQGFVKPEWTMLVRNDRGGEHLHGGVQAAFCAVPLSDNADGADGNCPRESLVTSASTALPMEGGNIPQEEDRVGPDFLYQKQEGWSVIGMAFVFAAVIATGTYFNWGAISGFLKGFSLDGAAYLSATQGALGAAGIGGLFYTGTNDLFNDAGGGDYQRGPFGNNVSFGTAHITDADFHDISIGSDEMKGFGNYFATEIHKKMRVTDPGRDSLKSINCMWAGANGCGFGVRGSDETFKIQAAADTRAEMVEQASKAALVRRQDESLKKQREWKAPADGGLVKYKRAVELIGENGSVRILSTATGKIGIVNVNHLGHMTLNVGGKISAYSAEKLRGLLQGSSYSVIE